MSSCPNDVKSGDGAGWFIKNSVLSATKTIANGALLYPLNNLSPYFDEIVMASLIRTLSAYRNSDIFCPKELDITKEASTRNMSFIKEFYAKTTTMFVDVKVNQFIQLCFFGICFQQNTPMGWTRLFVRPVGNRQNTPMGWGGHCVQRHLCYRQNTPMGWAQIHKKLYLTGSISQLTTHNSQLTTHNSQLTTHNSLPATN